MQVARPSCCFGSAHPLPCFTALRLPCSGAAVTALGDLQTAGIPLEKLKGFRAPFLVHDPAQRKILQENGFLYDRQVLLVLVMEACLAPLSGSILHMAAGAGRGGRAI